MKNRKKLNDNKKEFSYNQTRQKQNKERKKLSECQQDMNLSILDFSLQPLLALL